MGAGARVFLVVGVGAAAATMAMLDLAGAGEPLASVRLPFNRPTAATSEATVTVNEGDHLWNIARDHLENAVGDALTDRQIAGYWRSLVRLNAGRLRSGDPDLIFPGEVIALPPLPVSAPP